MKVKKSIIDQIKQIVEEKTFKTVFISKRITGKQR